MKLHKILEPLKISLAHGDSTISTQHFQFWLPLAHLKLTQRRFLEKQIRCFFLSLRSSLGERRRLDLVFDGEQRPYTLKVVHILPADSMPKESTEATLLFQCGCLWLQLHPLGRTQRLDLVFDGEQRPDTLIWYIIHLMTPLLKNRLETPLVQNG